MAQLPSLSKRPTRQRLPKTHRPEQRLKQPSKLDLSLLPRPASQPSKHRRSLLLNRRRQLKSRRPRKQLKLEHLLNLPRQHKLSKPFKPLRPHKSRPSNRLRPSLLLPKRLNRMPRRLLLRCKRPKLSSPRNRKWPIRHRPTPSTSLTSNGLLLLIWPLPSRPPTKLTRQHKRPRPMRLAMVTIKLPELNCNSNQRTLQSTRNFSYNDDNAHINFYLLNCLF